MITSVLRRLLLLAVLGGVTVAPVLGQADPLKFGKPDPKDFDAQNFVADSAAEAVVLCDFGRSRFEVGAADEGFRTVFEPVTRIKILKKAGYGWATVEVPLYHEAGKGEKLINLRGFTYNMVNGEVVKEKLEPSAAVREESSLNVTTRKFTLPNVREGAVIEYSYSVVSDFFFNYQDWQFQRSIPVRWSEYRAQIPEYFDYNIHVPAGFKPESLPAPVQLNTPFGTYSSQVRALPDGTLLYVRRLLMPRTRFPRTDYPAYQDFRRRIGAADKAQVVLVKTDV